MLPIHQLKKLLTALASETFVQKEYLCLPNFLVICWDVTEEASDCTIFNPYKIYGWDEFSQSYGMLLLDTHNHPTVGVWKNNTLAIYQDVSAGYLRLSYLVTTQKKPVRNWLSGDRKQYKFFVDISSNGSTWRGYTTGETGCS